MAEVAQQEQLHIEQQQQEQQGDGDSSSDAEPAEPGAVPGGGAEAPPEAPHPLVSLMDTLQIRLEPGCSVDRLPL
eukprot:5026629-Alexandrium_andersonii.AAC.1